MLLRLTVVCACLGGLGLVSGCIFADPWVEGYASKVSAPPGEDLPQAHTYDLQTTDHFDGGDFNYWSQVKRCCLCYFGKHIVAALPSVRPSILVLI